MKDKTQTQLFSFRLYCCLYPDCNKEYATKYNLLRHIEINHLKVRKSECPTCGRIFVSEESMKEHKYIHLNIKPFKCSLCDKQFRNKCVLIRHQRSHSYILIKNDESNSF